MSGSSTAIRRQIVDIVKREYRNGMVNMFEGNVSARLGERFFITPSQVAKEAMTEDLVIEIDDQGRPIDPPAGYKVSSEVMMHLEVYRLRPDVNAVIHNHSLYATAFAMNNMPIESDTLTEMNIIYGTVPVVPYGTPGSERIYRDFDKYLSNRRGVLLANHGLLTFGKTLELAYSYAESIEKIAQTICIAKSLGDSSPIPAEELAGLRAYGDMVRDKDMQS